MAVAHAGEISCDGCGDVADDDADGEGEGVGLGDDADGDGATDGGVDRDPRLRSQ